MASGRSEVECVRNETVATFRFLSAKNQTATVDVFINAKGTAGSAEISKRSAIFLCFSTEKRMLHTL